MLQYFTLIIQCHSGYIDNQQKQISSKGINTNRTKHMQRLLKALLIEKKEIRYITCKTPFFIIAKSVLIFVINKTHYCFAFICYNFLVKAFICFHFLVKAFICFHFLVKINELLLIRFYIYLFLCVCIIFQLSTY